jgi:hypothetical protein
MLKHLKSPLAILCQVNSFRCFSQTFVNNQQGNLYKLRKSTGYALSKCKEALEKYNGNVEEVFNNKVAFIFAYSLNKMNSFYFY